jgi:hypothetical protein
MPTYEMRDVIVSTGMVDSVPLKMCMDCGVPVLDQTIHNEFHASNERKHRRTPGLDRIG